MNASDLSSQFSLDMQGFQRMKHTAKVDPEAGVQSAAQQFEALFVQMMMKSMRDAIPASGLMSSSATESYQKMLDQQWSQVIAARGVGLAGALVQQLVREGVVKGDGASSTGDQQMKALIAGIPRGTPRVLDSPINPGDQRVPEANSESHFLAELDAVRQGQEVKAEPEPQRQATGQLPHVDQFMHTLGPSAQAASRATGVPAELILAQAALETGWGQHEIATQSGQNSHNVFGIKAGGHWDGETTDVVTHEYIDGRREKIVDAFRVYDSYEHAFTDYASLIGNNPRYAGVTQAPSAEQAARELQRGGYATDPRYAEKLVSVMDTLGPMPGTGNFLADSR